MNYLFVLFISFIFVNSTISISTATKFVDPLDEFANPILKIVNTHEPNVDDFQEFIRSLPELIIKTNDKSLRSISPHILKYLLRGDRVIDVPEEMKEVVDLALNQTAIFQKHGRLLRALEKINYDKIFESLIKNDSVVHSKPMIQKEPVIQKDEAESRTLEVDNETPKVDNKASKIGNETSKINNETPKTKNSEDSQGFFAVLTEKSEYLASFGEIWMIITFFLGLQVIIIWTAIIINCVNKKRVLN